MEKTTSKKRWLTAVCPVCGDSYSYKSDYKPSTCNKFQCIHEFRHRLNPAAWAIPPHLLRAEGGQL